jgi:hypothetical protein
MTEGSKGGVYTVDDMPRSASWWSGYGHAPSCFIAHEFPFRSREHRQTPENCRISHISSPIYSTFRLLCHCQVNGRGVLRWSLYGRRGAALIEQFGVCCRSEMPPKRCFLGTKPPTKRYSYKIYSMVFIKFLLNSMHKIATVSIAFGCST